MSTRRSQLMDRNASISNVNNSSSKRPIVKENVEMEDHQAEPEISGTGARTEKVREYINELNNEKSCVEHCPIASALIDSGE